MRKLDREIIEIAEGTPLHVFAEQLRALQALLPQGSEARVTVQGDENFGWRLVVSFFRELTAEETQIQRKYSPDTEREHRRLLERRRSA